jgi:hypothetical protein
MKRLALFALLTLALAACGASTELSSFEPPASVDVTFEVLAPQSTPEDAEIAIILLDAVTGDGLNQQAQTMRSDGDRSYTITLSVPAGTLLTYRYTRLGEANTPEASLDGSAISERLYLVDGPGHVAHDLIAAWIDQPASSSSGQLSGTLADGINGDPVSGVFVGAGGLLTITDDEGGFVLGGLPQGLHTLVAVDPRGRYQSFQQGALVAEGTDTPAEIALTPAQTVKVTLVVQPPEDSVPGVPLHIAANLSALNQASLSLGEDGRYAATLALPIGVDIRYKYTLGSGLWNAEHDADGAFVLRQVILSGEDEGLEIEDNLVAWTVGASSPIWFDLNAPDEGEAYIQFKLGDWSTPLAMWPLGGGHYAYKLYSPTNFAAPIEYRYCADSACERSEADGAARSVSSSTNGVQMIEDQVAAWTEELP